MMSDSHHGLGPTAALLGLTLFNISVIVGLLANPTPAIATPQVFVLAALELPVLFWIYRHTRRNSEAGLLQ